MFVPRDSRSTVFRAAKPVCPPLSIPDLSHFCPRHPSLPRYILTSFLQPPTRWNHLSQCESHDCLKQAETHQSDSFCRFEKSSAPFSVACALFREDMVGGVVNSQCWVEHLRSAYPKSAGRTFPEPLGEPAKRAKGPLFPAAPLSLLLTPVKNGAIIGGVGRSQ
jgi:hypothetical protein